MTHHPQTLDTDALRKLWNVAPGEPFDRYTIVPSVSALENFYNTAHEIFPAILDELDRLRAALATAPKAKDVRRKAIEECAKIADGRYGNAIISSEIRALAEL